MTYVNSRHAEQRSFIRLALKAQKIREQDMRLLKAVGRAA